MSNQTQPKQANWADEDDYDSEEADEEIGLNQDGSEIQKDSSKPVPKTTAPAKTEVSSQIHILVLTIFLYIEQEYCEKW